MRRKRGERRAETCSFEPERFDGLGFGPSAITVVSDPARRRALKSVNFTNPDLYEGCATAAAGPVAGELVLEDVDVRLLHVTRTLARLALDRPAYREAFGIDAAEEHAPALEALAREALVEIDERAIRLSPRGMFTADSVVGLIAWPRLRALRARVAPGSRPGWTPARPWRPDDGRDAFMG